MPRQLLPAWLYSMVCTGPSGKFHRWTSAYGGQISATVFIHHCHFDQKVGHPSNHGSQRAGLSWRLEAQRIDAMVVVAIEAQHEPVDFHAEVTH